MLQREVERALQALQQRALEIGKQLLLPAASLRAGVAYVLKLAFTGAVETGKQLSGSQVANSSNMLWCMIVRKVSLEPALMRSWGRGRRAWRVMWRRTFGGWWVLEQIQ